MTTQREPVEQVADCQTKRSVLRNLLVSMLSFGAVVGVSFPPFARYALGTEDAMSLRFTAMCVGAGLLVGCVNFIIFRVVVSRELVRVAEGMEHVNDAVARAEDTGEGCGEGCSIAVTSCDIIGTLARSFNDMTAAIAQRITVETRTRRLLNRLSASSEPDEAGVEILETMMGICGSRGGVLYGNTGNRYCLLASIGIDQGEGLPDRVDTEQGLTRRALETGQLMMIAPGREGFDWVGLSTPLGALKPELVALIPLMAEQRSVGLAVMVCDSDTMPGHKRSLIDAIRTQAAPYLQSAIMHRKLQELAAIDDLTRLLNRRFGTRRLHEEFSRAVRHGVPVSVMMLDIDHFKNVNDSFGHDAGDAVLSSIASTLEQSIRSGDVVCRYGGEEFMVVAPGMGMNDVSAAAERLRRQVAATPVRWSDKELSVTVSIGTATWPIVKASIEDELVTFADKALYRAKESGRNRIAVHQGDAVDLPADLTLEAE